MIKHVPIVPTTNFCKYMCCQKRFLPLVLAWSSTLHKAQGATYGHTPPGQPPNLGKKLIVDVGSSKMEKDCPGLAYVAVSRGNFMGKGYKMKSAIYFIRDNFNLQRLTGMSKLKNGSSQTLHCQRRENWIKHLLHSVHRKGVSDSEGEQIIKWAERDKVDKAH